MPPRWSLVDAAPQSRSALRLATLVAAITVTAALAVGCGHATAGDKAHAATTATPCGSTRTAANVPVKIEVLHGQVSCPDALTVERDYTKAIMAGKAPGEGGGGPVNVNGWHCSGFPTPQVLKTGWASKCVKSSAEILAILPPP
jgi:hypothetical protein